MNKLLKKQEIRYDLLEEYYKRYIGVDGDIRTGKTSFVVALNVIHRYFNPDADQYCTTKVLLYPVTKKEWKQGQDDVYTNPTHYDLVRMPKAEDDPEYRPFQEFEYGATITVSDQADENENNKTDNFDPGKYQFLKFMGHNCLTMLNETQRLTRLRAFERDFIKVFIYIKKRTNYMLFGRIKKDDVPDDRWWRRIRKTVWTYNLYEGSDDLIDAGYKHLEPLPKKVARKMRAKGQYDVRMDIKKKKLKFYGDVFKFFNSETMRDRFHEHTELSVHPQYVGNFVPRSEVPQIKKNKEG